VGAVTVPRRSRRGPDEFRRQRWRVHRPLPDTHVRSCSGDCRRCAETAPWLVCEKIGCLPFSGAGNPARSRLLAGSKPPERRLRPGLAAPQEFFSQTLAVAFASGTESTRPRWSITVSPLAESPFPSIPRPQSPAPRLRTPSPYSSGAPLRRKSPPPLPEPRAIPHPPFAGAASPR